MDSPSIVPAIPSHNALAADIFAANVHWWHHPATGERLDRNKGELFMLMVSEVAEAMEGERKNLMDDHLPHRRMAEVELADVLIRIYDFAGGFGLDLDGAIDGLVPDPMPSNKAEALLQIAREFTLADYEGDEACLAMAILLCHRYADAHGYDLDGAIAEKRAYNANRLDHQLAARLAADGKRF